jgi:hypothetical protein
MKMNKCAAADLLNVSRPYLQKLLDNGTLASLDDDVLLDYKDKRDAERRQSLDEQSAFMQENGFYDEQ